MPQTQYQILKIWFSTDELYLKWSNLIWYASWIMPQKHSNFAMANTWETTKISTSLNKKSPHFVTYVDKKKMTIASI